MKTTANGTTAAQVSNNNRENMNAANVASNNNKINDFGQKIGGARKDMYAAAREWAERLADITADKLAAAGLSKLVRLPNLEGMTAAGAITAEQARAALALWRTIDRKPAGTYKADRWADRTREKLAAIAAILTADDLAAVLSDDLAALPDYQVLTATNWPAEAFTFGRYQVRRRPAYYSNAGKLAIVGGRYFVGTSSDDPADIAAQLRTMTATDADRAAESRARGPKLGIYHTSDGTRYFIAVENKCEIVLKVCDTYRDAAEAVKNGRAALLERYNALKNFPALRRSWNRPRVGKEWHAEDVTPEQFAAALPFRGVEFGNWLNQQERAALLNSAFDGFHDLADLLGIPAEAVALGGRLNFSFATRGTANSAAHFESLYNTINLNKRNGAGCMAHEWLHACDHYAAVLSGRGNCTSWGEAFATEYKGEAVTDADRAARDIVAVIKSMDYYTRSRNYQRISGKQQGGEDYYIMPCELAARGFEGVCLYLLLSVGGCSDFLVNLQSWQDFERDDAGHRRDCYPYPSEAEAAALLPYYIKFFRALFGRCEVSKKAAEGVAAATLQAAEEKTEADRLAAEKAEQEKKAAEAIRAARRAEQEKQAAEAKTKAEQTRAAIVDRLTAAHFDTIATGFDSVAVYFAAHMQGEIFTGSVDIKTTEAEAVAAAQAAPLARVQYKRVHNAKRIICRRWKGAEVRANKYTAAEVLAELDGDEVRTIARTFADFEKAEIWNDAAHLWDDTQRAHEEQAARARQAAQERTAAKEPTDSKAESKQGATISDPRAAGLQLVTIAEGVAVVGAAEDERTRGRQTWKARRDIKAHGCTWNRTAQQWEATTAEAVAAVRAWFGESEEQDASEGTTAPAAAELTPVYYSASEISQPTDSKPAAIAASEEEGAPLTEPNRDGLPNWLHVGTRFCLLDFVTGKPTAVRYTCAAIDYEARTVTIPEAADAFRGGSHVYRWDAFHWNTFAPVTDDTDPTPDPSGDGEGVGTCHSYEQGAPCYSTSEKSQATNSKENAQTFRFELWSTYTKKLENVKTAPTYCPDYDPTEPQGARAVAAAASPDRVTLRTFTDRQRAPQWATSFRHRQEAAEWLSRAARGVGALAPEAIDVLKVAPDCLIYYSKRNGEYVCDFVADDEGRPLCGRVEDFRALLLLYRKRHQLERIAADITAATAKGQRLVTATEDDRARVIVEHDPDNDLYLSSWYVGQERDETRATLTARQAAEMVWTFREGYAADLGDIVTRCEPVSR